MPPLECTSRRSFLQRCAESVESLCSMGQRSLLALIGITVGSASIVALPHLSVVGALIGALLGCVVACLFTHARDWPLSVSLDSLLLGIGSSILIGLFFGCYPATVASRLSPVMALRDD